MASKDWWAGVYWEPKSPEWPPNSHQSGSRGVMSPNRIDPGVLSPYSDNNQSGFSPDYTSTTSSKRARWDWSPNSSLGNASSSPHWTEYQWSPSSSESPTSLYSANEGRYSIINYIYILIKLKCN